MDVRFVMTGAVRDDEGMSDLAIVYLKTGGSLTVEKLFSRIRELNPSWNEADMVRLVSHMVKQGLVEAEELFPSVNSMSEYLTFWEYNVGFYVSVAVSVVAFLWVFVVPELYPFVVLRWIIGSGYVLIMPGYAAVEALMPSGDVDPLKRFGLSVGLSLVLTPMASLLLNYTPWGIRLFPLMTMLLVIIVGLATIGFVRRFTTLSKLPHTKATFRSTY